MPRTASLSAFILCSTIAAIPSTTLLAEQAPSDNAAERARAVHVLNRLSFGPRPGEVDRVLAMGVDRWIDGQLRPESMVDSAGLRALDGCPIWTEPVEDALLSVNGRNASVAMTSARDGVMRPIRTVIVLSPSLTLIPRDSALRFRSPNTFLANSQLIGCRLARVEFSDQQLLEVMTNFWENHFSVYSRSVAGRGFVVEWDRVVLRPNALGRFRDLLGAVAHSAVMMTYLDNDVSTVDDKHPSLAEHLRVQPINTVPTYIGRRGLNENYGRELLELHTLGVDAGYTQQDVIEVARAFTGWTQTEVGRKVRINGRVPPRKPRLVRGTEVDVPGFLFDSTMHDAGPKVVLGHSLRPGRGMEDGEEVLDILARHPATARHIARKLAVRFVSDAPPEALIERAAATYLRTDGNIREVVRTIVTSPEFFSPAIYGAKVKTPIELVLSARRALGAAPDTAAEVVDLLIKLDQTPFGHVAPDGWPETGAPWLSAGAMMKRMDLAINIGRDKLSSIPLSSWPAWRTLSNQSFDRQVDGVLQALLNGQATPGLRNSLLANRPKQAPTTAAEREQSLRELVVLVLGSPAFQRR